MIDITIQFNRDDVFINIRKDNENFMYTETPTEIADAVDALKEYAIRQKSDAEILADNQIKYIQETTTDDEQVQNIQLFPAWRTTRLMEVGQRFAFQGKLYEVVQEHISQADWKPTDTPALFRLIGTVADAEAGVVPDFIQPTGAHDAYKIGDRVIFEGKTYESVIDSNVWTPETYPAGWQVREETV